MNRGQQHAATHRCGVVGGGSHGLSLRRKQRDAVHGIFLLGPLLLSALSLRGTQCLVVPSSRQIRPGVKWTTTSAQRFGSGGAGDANVKNILRPSMMLLQKRAIHPQTSPVVLYSCDHDHDHEEEKEVSHFKSKLGSNSTSLASRIRTKAVHTMKIIGEKCGVYPFTEENKMKRFLSTSSLAFVAIFFFSHLAMTKTVAKAATATTALAPQQLLSAFFLVLVSGGIGLSVGFGLMRLATELLTACARCTLQVYLVGGFVLSFFLGAKHPLPVAAWLLVSGWFASREAASRVEYAYPNLQKHCTMAIAVGASTVLASAAALGILGQVQPWFAPRTWIPISGMLLGNTLTAASLAAGTFTKELQVQRPAIEVRLARGASWEEAMQPTLSTTLRSALMPVIHMLSVTGIVHIPGMMSGQLLAGQGPFQAAAYQVMIFFLIASTVSITTQTLTKLILNEMVDKSNHRLRLERMTFVKRNKEDEMTLAEKGRRVLSDIKRLPTKLPSLYKKSKKIFSKTAWTRFFDTTTFDDLELPYLYLGTSRNVKVKPSSSGGEPVLRLEQLFVPRAGVKVSLDLYRREHIGIRGASGVGKSQLLRTIAGLEYLNRTSAVLNGKPCTDMSMPDWRRCVVLVGQDRPHLEGTPRQLYDQCFKHYSQVTRPDKPSGYNGDRHREPDELAQAWGLDPEVWDRPWSTLSGGETQRALLAIALSLRPKVLLLDEATSALDDASTIKVEETINYMKIPTIIVSHKETQLTRFCSRIIDLGANVPYTNYALQQRE